jgi:hypothetical protein
VPSGFTGVLHVPEPGSQTPATWQSSAATQMTELPPTHAPATQESVCVQASPSSQAVPSASVGFEQTPVAALHTPAAWHWSAAAQVVAVPVQLPATQESPFVQALPSSQVVPSATSAVMQAPVVGLQLEARHALLAPTNTTDASGV